MNDPLVGLRKQRPRKISRRSGQLLALFSSYPLFFAECGFSKNHSTPSATQTQMSVLVVEEKGWRDIKDFQSLSFQSSVECP